MNKPSRRSKTPATSWPIICLLMVLAASSAFQTGSANGQSAELDETQEAFFLLKYDYDVLVAKSKGKARSDSLILFSTVEFHEQQFADFKKQRNREYVLIGVTVILTGLLFYYGAKVE